VRSRAKGLYRVEDLIAIAERVVAALQDAGVTHVADVAVYYRPSDARGAKVAIGTDAGPIEDMSIDCTGLAVPMAAAAPRVLRPAHGHGGGPRLGRARTSNH
jgi:hypothetical protein